MIAEAAKASNPRARLMAVLRTYIHYGVDNPALYRLMFGGYLSGPDAGRPAIERAAAERARACLPTSSETALLGTRSPTPHETNARSRERFWRAGRLSTASRN